MEYEAPDPRDVIASYTVEDWAWFDMPEAKPRTRAKVAEGRPPARVDITSDGAIHCPDEIITDTNY